MDFVDVVRRASALQFDSLGMAMGDGDFAARLEEGKVVGEQQGGCSEAVAAVLAAEPQQCGMLAQLIV